MMYQENKKVNHEMFHRKTQEYGKPALSQPQESADDSSDLNDDSAGAKWHVKQLQAAEEKYKELKEMQKTIKHLVPPTISTTICSRSTSRGKSDNLASPPHEHEIVPKTTKYIPATARSIPEPLTARERPVSQWPKRPQPSEKVVRRVALRSKAGILSEPRDGEYKARLILKKVRRKVNEELFVPIRNTKLTLDRETIRSISSHRFARAGPRRRTHSKLSRDVHIHLLPGPLEQLQRTCSIYHSKTHELPAVKGHKRGFSRASPVPQQSLGPIYRPLNAVVMDVHTQPRPLNAD